MFQRRDRHALHGWLDSPGQVRQLRAMQSFQNPRVAIVGAGAIGLYYGARLARAGADVRFLVRGDYDALRERNRISVREKGGEWEIAPVRVENAAAAIGPVDLVLIGLKATANQALPQLLPPLVGPETAVVTLQNGLGHEEQLATWVGAERTLGALCFIGMNRVGPGQLHGFHSPGSMTLGEFGRPAGNRTRAIAGLFQNAGVKCLAVDDLHAARWRKLVWNVPFNGLTIAAGGVPTDVICADPALLREARALMGEVARAAAGFGVTIPESFIETQLDVTPPMGPYRPSSLIDYLAGREVEVEPIWGEPVRRAESVGVAVPRMALLYALLRRLTLQRRA
jgi:2-dehydropantoate 2-reductase